MTISHHRLTWEFLPSLSLTKIEWQSRWHYTLCLSFATYSVTWDWDQ